MTKKYITKILSITLTLCMLFTTMSFAAPKEKDISATTNPELIVYINGCKQYLVDGQGNPISPILYNNTNYLPARFVIETLGARLNYDAKSLTISVTDNDGLNKGESYSHSISESTSSGITNNAGAKNIGSGISSSFSQGYSEGTNSGTSSSTGSSTNQSQTQGISTNTSPKRIKAKTNPSLKLVVRGVNKKMVDGQNKEITAINYNNTNYLPLRFLADSLGFEVTYIPDITTVMLNSKNGTSFQNAIEMMYSGSYSFKNTKMITSSIKSSDSSIDNIEINFLGNLKSYNNSGMVNVIIQDKTNSYQYTGIYSSSYNIITKQVLLSFQACNISGKNVIIRGICEGSLKNGTIQIGMSY